MLNSVNYSYITETLSITQRQGIITVIPKRDKDLLLVKNWRPISLLNVDYKLIAKCIATRIKTVLPSIIHEDQSGFLKNKYIGENLIRTINLIEYSQRNNLNTCLTTIDFEKAFYFLEKSYIAYCLKFFKFGPNIIKWIKILYNQVSSCVINNGHFTPFFPIDRGVRQGCPLSPYIFIIAVESLAIRIRNNDNIKGIEISGFNPKICQ